MCIRVKLGRATTAPGPAGGEESLRLDDFQNTCGTMMVGWCGRRWWGVAEPAMQPAPPRASWPMHIQDLPLLWLAPMTAPLFAVAKQRPKDECFFASGKLADVAWGPLIAAQEKASLQVSVRKAFAQVGAWTQRTAKFEAMGVLSQPLDVFFCTKAYKQIGVCLQAALRRRAPWLSVSWWSVCGLWPTVWGTQAELIRTGR